MRRLRIHAPGLVALLLAVAGCGSSSQPADSSTAKALHGKPQVIEPTAGNATSPIETNDGTAIVGDVNAHAPPLSEIKRELDTLNLCGGATSSAFAEPFKTHAAPGFVADPGTVQNVGQLPELTTQLNALARALGVTIYGISGYRSPAHSVAVGGYADDPHTKGEAEDIGVDSLLRSSAAHISEAELARFGLYRPFDPSDNQSNTEVNHIQLIPSGGPVSVTVVEATFDPDPACK